MNEAVLVLAEVSNLLLFEKGRKRGLPSKKVYRLIYEWHRQRLQASSPRLHVSGHTFLLKFFLLQSKQKQSLKSLIKILQTRTFRIPKMFQSASKRNGSGKTSKESRRISTKADILETTKRLFRSTLLDLPNGMRNYSASYIPESLKFTANKSLCWPWKSRIQKSYFLQN